MLNQVHHKQQKTKKTHIDDATTYEPSDKKSAIFPLPNIQKRLFKAPMLIHQEGIASKKSIAEIYLISHVIGVIECHKCYHHSYLVFYIPAILMVAQQFGHYSNEKYLHSYKLFTFLIKRALEISKLPPKQLQADDLPHYLTIAINYHKNIQKVEMTFKQFLQQKEQRMKAFMPIYYLYFKMIADKQVLLGNQPSIDKARSVIAEVEKEFDKYRSKEL